MSADKDFFKYLRKLKLLYVEDDNNTREELEYFLKNKVSELYVAKNGQEGLELFEKHQPDLIITDNQMPIMTGIKMIKLIKQINATIPIIIITAFNDADYLFEAIKLNVTSYLTKPLNLFSLSEVLFNISKNIDLENENRQIYNSLKQYKDIVDECSIIFKTDIIKMVNTYKEAINERNIISKKDNNDNVIECMGIYHDISNIGNMHKELEDTQREIIYKLSDITESRSSETGQHVKRVAEYSKLLAIKIGLNEKDVNQLFMVSPMHDVGKVGIPDSILNKNGKLDSAEWEIMKTHAQIGYDILKTSKRDILQTAAIISFTHHERWDGSGYPLGLKGEDIHIFGRITAVADVFDVLGSDRVYKKAWSLEKILELFKEEKGKHFDPNLIDIFLDNLDEFLEIRDTYKDVN